MATSEDRFRRTIPWHPGEMLLVDGVPCIYTAMRRSKEGDIVVHRPGQPSATVANLRATGHAITMPKGLRLTPPRDAFARQKTRAREGGR
jgi:hypothetical protein